MSASPPQVFTVRFSQPPSAVRIGSKQPLYLGRPAAMPWETDGESPPHSLSPAAQSPRIDEQRLAQARDDARLCGLLERLADGVRHVEERREQALRELQQAAVELATAAAARLVREAIDREQFGVDRIVAGLVDQLGPGRLTVELHPEDRALLESRARREGSPLRLDGITIIEDRGLKRGDCRVRSDDGSGWVTDIAARLADIRRQWLEELDDAQVERRRAQDPDGTLRRFPDRREIG